MNETHTKVYHLIFTTDKGSDHTFKIINADDSLSNVQIGNIMQKILDSGVVKVKGNVLTGLSKAYLETISEYETLF